MTTDDTRPTRSLTGPERNLQILEGITLTLLAIGITLMIALVRRIDLQVVLIVVAGLMLGISTVVSMHRRRTGYDPAIQERPFGMGFLLRIAPSILILAAVIIGFTKGG